MNCIIVDDEPKNVRVLTAMLAEFCPDTSVIGVAANAGEAEKIISKSQPDLVFLDVEMPYGNAFDLLDRLMPVNFEVVFVTAFNDYTLKAFKYSALDYLLKPVNIGELRAAVQKASEKLRLRNMNKQLHNLLANLKQPNASTYKLALPSMEGLVFVMTDKIMRCEASGGYTVFHMKEGEKILSAKNIKEYEEILPPLIFMRVHNSHIINLMCIKKYHKGRGGYIEMEDQALIEVASRRKTEFLNRFGY
ncbi:MAG: LytTR family DNA-binding domain-containing protein [Bacteroidota bacterium]|nr:LytTR family DNA-binding domain-containing protein [Bacteroidota bacterium]MDP4217574.1 LytTR family DNA-binding domain-containing protein [Bacteroidota bacterium]MDP4244999.1 LytTR family DNA-binding domain-containing protein [Bacteroidota bacterium]MDP4252895.1 LytTR family DNA-binding domain-containing protein [Bacteroidota bacterium]MDP4259116.1 LytTR family DNA-binding domain-containing protein [Bacteroidota bacterium]